MIEAKVSVAREPKGVLFMADCCEPLDSFALGWCGKVVD
jgi:hypothetical protein